MRGQEIVPRGLKPSVSLEGLNVRAEARTLQNSDFSISFQQRVKAVLSKLQRQRSFCEACSGGKELGPDRQAIRTPVGLLTLTAASAVAASAAGPATVGAAGLAAGLGGAEAGGLAKGHDRKGECQREKSDCAFHRVLLDVERVRVIESRSRETAQDAKGVHIRRGSRSERRGRVCSGVAAMRRGRSRIGRRGSRQERPEGVADRGRAGSRRPCFWAWMYRRNGRSPAGSRSDSTPEGNRSPRRAAALSSLRPSGSLPSDTQLRKRCRLSQSRKQYRPRPAELRAKLRPVPRRIGKAFSCL